MESKDEQDDQYKMDSTRWSGDVVFFASFTKHRIPLISHLLESASKIDEVGWEHHTRDYCYKLQTIMIGSALDCVLRNAEGRYCDSSTEIYGSLQANSRIQLKPPATSNQKTPKNIKRCLAECSGRTVLL